MNENKLKKLNVIYSENVKKIKFGSINKVLRKADKVYVIVEKWSDENDSSVKAYEVKMIGSLGSM